jgi:anti-sigma factor RsiW
MNCAETVAELGAYLDGQLALGVRSGLELHLADCVQCRERFAREAQLERVIAHSLRAAPERAAQDAAWDHALTRAFAAAPLPVTATSWWARFQRPPPRSQLRWFALVASLALLATFSMAGLGLRRTLHATAPLESGQLNPIPASAR